MEKKNLHRFLIGLLAVALAFPLLSSCAEDIREIRQEMTSRQLEGRWYVNGDRNRVAEIYSTRGGLEARNERGDTSPIEYDRRGEIRATNWENGLRGDVRRDSIQWANGTTWSR